MHELNIIVLVRIFPHFSRKSLEATRLLVALFKPQFNILFTEYKISAFHCRK